MTHYEKSFNASASYGRSPGGIPIARTIKTAALLALLLAYALSFAILYPVAQASVSKSAAEGNDPTALGFVSP